MEPVRLQKFLADTGICSRRAGEQMIAAGEVEVNGEIATLGQKVTPDVDRIAVRGRLLTGKPQPRVTLAIHKPRGAICSNADPEHPITVFDFVPRDFSKLRFFCAGRLDLDSEGLVILTTDGDLAHQIMHPSREIVKRYRVILKQPFPKDRLLSLIKGVSIEGERLKVERAYLLGPTRAATAAFQVEVHMHHGRKREIRQLFTTLGYDVKRLIRFQIGKVLLKGIPLRGARFLQQHDIDLLFATDPRPIQTASKKS